MSAVSDEFEGMGNQTPLFVVQATNTEIFCEASAELTAKLHSYTSSTSLLPERTGKILTLKDRVMEAENLFCSREEAAEILENMRLSIARRPLADQIDKLYTTMISPVDGSPDACVSIGKWIDENNSDELFAVPVRETETYLAPAVDDFYSSASLIQKVLGYSTADKNKEVRMISKKREVIKGYRVTTSGLPYVHLVVRFEPLLKAVDPIECHIAPILSRNRMIIFIRFRKFSYTDWDTTSPSMTTSWVREEVALKRKSEMDATIDKIGSGLDLFTHSYLIQKFPEYSDGLDEDNERIITPGSAGAS